MRNRIDLGIPLAVLLILSACTNASPRATPSATSPTPPPSPAPSFTPVAGEAFVRVDQVGYPAGVAVRAFLMASAPEDGGTFEVASKDTVVAGGPVGEDLGAWNDGFGHVHALDFTVTDPGTYTIRVSAPVSAESPVFRVDSPATLFAPLLSNALSFFQTQQDGPDVVPGPLARKPSHLNDATAGVYEVPTFHQGTLRDPVPVPGAEPRDVSGGWFDAGDYIKGVQTASYAADVLLIGVRDHPSLLGSGAPADFAAEMAKETDWLLKMWDDRTSTLYYQVMFGDGNDHYAGDHDLWRLPEVDDTYGGHDPYYRYIRHRPVFRAAPPGSKISPNLAGRMAAAFALCSQVYRPTDPSLSDRCLLAGQHVFDLADTQPRGHLLTFSPFDFYPETEWQSDLELGAAELALATSAPGVPTGLPHAEAGYYLAQSAHWAAAAIALPKDQRDTLNLYDVSGIAHPELITAMSALRTDIALEVTRDQLLADMKQQLDGAVARAAKDPFGYGFIYAAFDGTSHAQGLAIMASLYNRLTGNATYAEFGRRQLDIVLGQNAWGTSFIAGAGTTFPFCLHHQIANLVGSLDGSSPVALGAPVNGTNSLDVFEGLGLPDGAKKCPPERGDRYAPFNGASARFLDNAGSWPTVEPAIDFAASTPLAFALLIESGPG